MRGSKITRAMDYIDDDLIAAAAQEKSVREQPRERKPFFTKKLFVRCAAVAAAAVLLVTGGIVAANLIGGGQAITVVAFDVNPSLEIEVNDKEEVVKVNALNEDAKIVLEEMDFKGVGLDVTVNALIGSMLKHGYLSVEQNSILISVNTKDDGRSTTLQRSLSDSISALLSGSNIQASVMTQSFDGKKGKEGASAAKAALIDKIVAAGLTRADGSKYTYGQLVSLRVHELKLMLESKGFTVSGIAFSGKASEGMYIGESRAIEIVCEHQGLSVGSLSGVEIELDFDDDTREMTYEVEFVYGGFEYEYELNATTGAIVEYEKERED